MSSMSKSESKVASECAASNLVHDSATIFAKALHPLAPVKSGNLHLRLTTSSTKRCACHAKRTSGCRSFAPVTQTEVARSAHKRGRIRTHGGRSASVSRPFPARFDKHCQRGSFQLRNCLSPCFQYFMRPLLRCGNIKNASVLLVLTSGAAKQPA